MFLKYLLADFCNSHCKMYEKVLAKNIILRNIDFHRQFLLMWEIFGRLPKDVNISLV